MPDSLKSIGDYAFYACPSLKEVHVPDGCKVGDYAFGYTDGTATDADGRNIPEQIEGFRRHNAIGTAALLRILLVVAGVIAVVIVIWLLVRVIRKTQRTPEEADEDTDDVDDDDEDDDEDLDEDEDQDDA